MKPGNILFISQPGGQYQFQLGDFGLCNRIVDAAIFAGTRHYMAPKMLQEGRVFRENGINLQTKIDSDIRGWTERLTLFHRKEVEYN